MTKAYDLVAIGSGTAATVAATRLRAAGRAVAVVDQRPLGGTSLRGCDPKKLLVGAAEAADHARRMRSRGVHGDIGIDRPELLAFKRSFTDPIPATREQRYQGQGVGIYRGVAKFTSGSSLQVGGATLEARHVLIASGAEPAKLGIPGEEYLITHEGFLDLPALLRRILLVGGGYIAAEFSHIAARAGAQVTILQHGERMLKGFDSDLVAWLMEAFDEIGIDVRLQSSVKAVEKNGAGHRVHASSEGQALTLEADVVVHAAGRVPALASLELETAGVVVERGRLKLNEFLQNVSNPCVYAAGDAAQAGPPLTPVSSHDAKVVAANLLEGNHRSPDYSSVPSVAFTIPPIAAVGLSEAAAREQGLKFTVKSQKAPDWFTAPGRAVGLRLQDTGRGRHRRHSRCASGGPACGRSHQPVRARDPAPLVLGRSQERHVCLS